MSASNITARLRSALRRQFSAPTVRDAIAIGLYLGAGAISLLLFLLTVALGYPSALNCALAVCTVVLSVFFCVAFRKNLGLFLVSLFIAYTNYSIAVGVYLFPALRVPLTLYSQFTKDETYGIAVCCTLLFELIFYLFIYPIYRDPETIDPKNASNVDNFEYNVYIAIGALLVYTLIFFSNFKLGGDGERGSSGALGEYRTVVMILGCYFSGRKRVYKYLWTALVVLTGVLVLMSGNRVDMFGSTICLLVFWYADRISYRKVLMLLPVAVVGLAAVGFFRAESPSVAMLWHTVSELWDSKLMYEGAVYAYLPSLSVVELTYTIPLGEKLRMLWEHVCYIFTLWPAGASRADLSDWSRQYFSHYWGYISPTYFFFWFRYFGAILFGMLLCLYTYLYKLCISLRTKRYFQKWFYVLGMYFICNVARWYEYGPMGLLRGMFVCSVATWIVLLFDLSVRALMPRVAQKIKNRNGGAS